MIISFPFVNSFLVLLLGIISYENAVSSGSPYFSAPSFLKSTYKLKGDDDQIFYIRQVPGDGGCLFHSIAAAISFFTYNKHLDFDWRMRYLSNRLRSLAVHSLMENQTMVVEQGELIDSASLLDMVGEHYNMSSIEYCRQMLDPRTWGGGPEIVALSNHFRCPIHVYQLCVVGMFPRRSFRLEICAKFGSPTFDNKYPIRLLCADGRFPNISPGQQKPIGDHFLTLFLQQECSSKISASKSPARNSVNPRFCPEFLADLHIIEHKDNRDLLSRLATWLSTLSPWD